MGEVKQPRIAAGVHRLRQDESTEFAAVRLLSALALSTLSAALTLHGDRKLSIDWWHS